MDMTAIINRHAKAARRVAVPAETTITIEPFPEHPGFVAAIAGRLADPETDPHGVGATREAAALELARSLLDHAPETTCLAIAAVMREDMAEMIEATGAPAAHANIMRIAYERAIRLVEGIA